VELQLRAAAGYIRRMMRLVSGGLWAVCLMAGCALRVGAPAGGGSGLVSDLQPAEDSFELVGRREVGVVYSVQNRAVERVLLEFPTEQRLEVTLLDRQGRQLFLWSEDRSFHEMPSQVAVNPGERLEYAAGVPTRDMEAGEIYMVEAVLVGHPATAARATLRPR